MSQEHIVLLCTGLGFCVIGVLLIRNPRFARWGLTHGRARLWIKLLGEERAMKLTKYVFGPLTFLLGAVSILIMLFDR